MRVLDSYYEVVELQTNKIYQHTISKENAIKYARELGKGKAIIQHIEKRIVEVVTNVIEEY